MRAAVRDGNEEAEVEVMIGVEDCEMGVVGWVDEVTGVDEDRGMDNEGGVRVDVDVDVVGNVVDIDGGVEMTVVRDVVVVGADISALDAGRGEACGGDDGETRVGTVLVICDMTGDNTEVVGSFS